MKYLLIAPRFHTNLYYRTKALTEAGHQVKVAVLYKGKSEYYENIDIIFLKYNIPGRILSWIIRLFNQTNLTTALELRIKSPSVRLKKIIKNYQPDVILLKAYQNMLAIKVLLWAKKYKTKILMLTQTDKTHIKGSKFLFRLNMELFSRLGVSAYITPIKSNYDEFKKFGIENVYYLPFVYPVENKCTKNFTKNHLKILSIGKFVKRKDQILLLKAFEKLIKNYPYASLTLIGEKADLKYMLSLQNYILDNDLAKQVTIEWNIPYPKIIELYKIHDVFVLPSYAEPAAYTPVEAMAHGLPVICSDECGTKCYITEDYNGYIFRSHNVESLLHRLLKLTDISKLTELSRNACITAKKYHNPTDFARRIEEISGYSFISNS